MNELKQTKLKDFFAPKTEAMTRATIIRTLDTIITGYPKISVAQHIKNIFRSKGEVQNDPFNWKDERTLQKLQKYYSYLEENYDNETGTWLDEEVDEEFLKERGLWKK